MKLESNIAWCDATTNAVTGCDKVSPGCAHCYAEAGTRARVLRAQGVETWGPKGKRIPVNFEPVVRQLNKLCVCERCHEAHEWPGQTGSNALLAGMPCLKDRGDGMACDGRHRRIRLFADSNSDWLDAKWPVETLARFLNAIRLAPNIDVQLLTKRIQFFERLTLCLDANHWGENEDGIQWLDDWVNGIRLPKNIWLGVSVENQKLANERIPQLLKTPAAVRFLSVEPLLGPVNIDEVAYRIADQKHAMPGWGHRTLYWPDWVIVGGESGPQRRDCGVEAIVNVAQQCQAARVPVFVKQDCAALPGRQGRIPDDIWQLKQFPAPLERTPSKLQAPPAEKKQSLRNGARIETKTHVNAASSRVCIPTSGAVKS